VLARTNRSGENGCHSLSVRKRSEVTEGGDRVEIAPRFLEWEGRKRDSSVICDVTLSAMQFGSSTADITERRKGREHRPPQTLAVVDGAAMRDKSGRQSGGREMRANNGAATVYVATFGTHPTAAAGRSPRGLAGSARQGRVQETRDGRGAVTNWRRDGTSRECVRWRRGVRRGTDADGASLQRELRCDWAEVASGMDCESQSE
jgi:hypothetical protein